ncbi:MAG TPA: Type 1 glutamine amidotransferase-like domain-containing protein [Desulfobacterales bacterium]|nr:Type 1 glutamine amidotransferase-like domain-containing protein [Desulfobacterales bacterium]
MGFVLLEGGREFNAGMAAADKRAMAVCGGRAQPVRIIPAAAAPDDNHGRAAANGVGWFQSLGAADVRAVDVIDRASADRPDLAREIERARLVFVLGGFTRYLAETLSGSLAWQAMVSAHRSGSVIAGSSAGAMVMCEHYFDPTSGKVLPGLNLLPNVSVLPHHDTFGKDWAPRLTRLLPGRILIGIDEETGLLNDGEAGQWTVYGKGAVTVYEPGGKSVLQHGKRFVLPIAVRDHS